VTTSAYDDRGVPIRPSLPSEMAYLINSPGLSTEGTSGNDFFSVQSGGLSATTIKGLAGNDTVQMNDDVASAKSVVIDLAGGADLMTASGIDFTASTILGGAGADKIIGMDTHLGLTKMGEGNDTIQLSAGLITTLEGGSGADSLVNSAVVSATAAAIKMGAGNDTIGLTASALLNSAEILGGGGADSIVFSSNAEQSFLLINGDSGVNGGGNDTLTLAFTGASSTVKGKGGADLITLQGAGELNASSQVLGNAGADSIIIDATISADSNVTIGGGAGNDTIVLTSVATGSVVQGGGGVDSINIDFVAGAGADSGFATLAGGAGKDSVTFSAQAGVTTGALIATQIKFEAFTDSTADGMDLYTFTQTGAAVSAGGTKFMVNVGAIASANTAGTINYNSASIAAGVATFSSVSALSSRIEKLDGLLTTTGQYALFTDVNASAGYIFVQGGDSDIVAKFENTESVDASGLAVAGNGSAFTITLS